MVAGGKQSESGRQSSEGTRACDEPPDPPADTGPSEESFVFPSPTLDWALTSLPPPNQTFEGVEKSITLSASLPLLLSALRKEGQARWTRGQSVTSDAVLPIPPPRGWRYLQAANEQEAQGGPAPVGRARIGARVRVRRRAARERALPLPLELPALWALEVEDGALPWQGHRVDRRPRRNRVDRPGLARRARHGRTRQAAT